MGMGYGQMDYSGSSQYGVPVSEVFYVLFHVFLSRALSIQGCLCTVHGAVDGPLWVGLVHMAAPAGYKAILLAVAVV